MRRFASLGLSCLLWMGCSGHEGTPAAPTAAPPVSATAGTGAVTTASAQPPFNLEAVLRGDGFGLVKFRQEIDSAANIVTLDVWVRDLAANASYSLQRAVDTTLDGECTGTNWLTLGKGTVPDPILTDASGTGRASLWRDLSAVAAGTAFDIHFRVVDNATSHVALTSDCYRFIVRN